jgi:hypothetical protein
MIIQMSIDQVIGLGINQISSTLEDFCSINPPWVGSFWQETE